MLILLFCTSIVLGKLVLSEQRLLSHHDYTGLATRDGIMHGRHSRQRLWWGLIFHASLFQLVCPLPTSTSVTMLQMLSEVICSEKLLCLIAFAKLVSLVQVVDPILPLGWIHELFTAISTGIGSGRVEGSIRLSLIFYGTTRRWKLCFEKTCGCGVEGILERGQDGAGPGMFP